MAELPKEIINHPAFQGVKAKLDAINVPSTEALDFVNKTNATEGDMAGATLHLGQGKVLQPNEPGVVVGGEPNKATGQPIATHLYDTDSPQPNLSLNQFADEATRIKKLSSHPDASIGSWFERGAVRDRDKMPLGIQIDASRIFEDKHQAARMTIKRDQDAAWNNGEMEPINYAEAAQLTGNLRRQRRSKKLEIAIPKEAKPGTPEFEGK